MNVNKEISVKEREWRKRQREMRRLTRTLDRLCDEHDTYRIEGVDAINEWFHSFPIESLNESLSYERGHKRTKFSLRDIAQKGKLRKEFFSKSDEFDVLKHKEQEAHIDLALARIKKIIK